MPLDCSIAPLKAMLNFDIDKRDDFNQHAIDDALWKREPVRKCL